MGFFNSDKPAKAKKEVSGGELFNDGSYFKTPTPAKPTRAKPTSAKPTPAKPQHATIFDDSDSDDYDAFFTASEKRGKDNKSSAPAKPAIQQQPSDNAPLKPTYYSDDVEMGNYDKKHRERKGYFPKFMPHQKRNEEELFQEAFEIPAGPKFDELFNTDGENEITVEGGDGTLPRISSFGECCFTEEMIHNLKLKKHYRPLPVQGLVIPLIQEKKQDIICFSKTGSGKTAAIMLPIVNEIHLFKEENNIGKNPDSPLAILLSPTKELTEQLKNDIRSYALKTRVNVAFSFGDVPFGENIRMIRRDGCDIFVATVGRAMHFVRENIIKLDDLRYFVCDEADKLLREGFINDVLRVKRHPNIDPGHRTFLFSATFDESAFEKFQLFVKPDFFFVRVGGLNHAVGTVKQEIFEVKKYDKYEFLLDLLKEKATKYLGEDKMPAYRIEKTIIFAGQKRRTDRLAIGLAGEGFRVQSTNGDRTLQQRDAARDDFILDKYDILVGTDVLSRGLNIPNVMHVISFDVPQEECQSYIHRIGRTGRAGNLGRATTFFDPDEDIRHAKFYVKVLTDAKQKVPKFLEDIVANEKLAEEETLRVCDKNCDPQVEESKKKEDEFDIWA